MIAPVLPGKRPRRPVVALKVALLAWAERLPDTGEDDRKLAVFELLRAAEATLAAAPTTLPLRPNRKEIHAYLDRLASESADRRPA